MKILTGVSWSKSTDLIDSSRWHLADFISICQSLYEGASVIKSFWIVYPWYLKEVTVLVLSFSGPASSCWTSLFYPIPLDSWFSFFHFGSVQFSSVAQSCPTVCDHMNLNRSTPGLPVHHQLPEFTQTHVPRVGDAIQPSHPLFSLFLLPSIFPSIRVFSNESTLHMRWPKY